MGIINQLLEIKNFKETLGNSLVIEDVRIQINCMIIKKLLSKYYKKKINFKKPNDLIIKKKKICGILQEIIHYGAKTYLIVGVGINTNISTVIKNYKVTSLNNVLNKKIDNSKLLRETKKKYEKFIQQIEKNNFTELKRKILKLK